MAGSKVTASIHIARPPQDVWDFIMDPANSGDWVTIHRGLGKVDKGDLREGFKMEQSLCLRGVTFKVKWELAEMRAPFLAVWEGRGPARSHASIVDRLSEEKGGTRFHYENEFKAPLGPLGAVASKALVGGVPEREANASLEKLKKLLER